MPNKRGFHTRAIHVGYEPDEALGALTPPIHMSSTFTFGSAEDASATFAGDRKQYVYGRVHNPTQALLEARLADLEGGTSALATASGMGAIGCVIWSILKPNDRVVVHRRLYGNTFTLFRHELPSWNVDVTFADLSDPAQTEAAIRPGTQLVFFETPANPSLELIDIAAVSAIARQAGALTVVDNTFCTPYLQRPLELGADLVVHSMTKYLCGHGDVVAGAVIGAEEIIKTVRMNGLRFITGATISPIAAFLVLRGLKTLGLRMERHSHSALRISRLLERHPKVARVFYPGLQSHPQFQLAKSSLPMFGGLISLELKGGAVSARRMMNNVRLTRIAVSLGDAETLIQHPVSMTHSAYGAEDLARFGISSGLVRISVGLEDVEDIEQDLLSALDAA
ncbi:aminotransferase class I/II-fold pyridoxal phosphate-dependent enzyme [Caballeronia sp. dw_276]|uniref:trans-sulfuration enzyme family protein n=1 Tax=Caballeronia sp. dw_276 TaxID=2719795 RepID=UPI001BD2BCE2|nr:aminotransferase class I/II-fold pyridoxal phosphate-dependent enzyme [Caballeronia sp. dw_276]